ncbi:MAG: 50S ribosomal protein L9 [Bacteroidales bacterium]|nr:50S ribosomal protein L9 [Bacteroidales bacterium]
MEVILKQDVAGLGHKNEIVKVKNGYAINYLIPKGLAIIATESAKKVLKETIKQQAHKEQRLREEAEEVVNKLSKMIINIPVKASSTGKIFGSVTTIQIAEALQKEGFNIDRKNITILEEDHIKQIGKYKAKAKIYKDIVAEITFEVIAE